MSDPQANPKLRLLFLGLYISLKDKKKYHRWYDVTGVENDGSSLLGKLDDDREHLYGAKKPLYPVMPGAIIEIEQNPDRPTSVLVNTAKHVDNWKNQEDVIYWRAEHRSKERAMEESQKAIKEMRSKLVAERLEPFRIAYLNCGNAQRRAHLLAFVIECITSPRSLKGVKSNEGGDGT